MYSEIGFIFNPYLSVGNFNNKDNEGSIYGTKYKVRIDGTSGLTDGILIYKSPSSHGTQNIINYISDNVYRNDDSDEDPYISLIRYFNESRSKAMALRAADFAYLKDLGVYPINRLWILRRFSENVIVPDNLLEWDNSIKPISIVVGWIKDDDRGEFLSLGFNEVWTDQTEMIDKVIAQVLKDNFGFELQTVMSVPGWAQGILFGVIKAAGLTSNFDARNVPTGDPNVLRIATMRDISSQGLSSDIDFTLETCYEQKYINGIDPGMAMLDILNNLLKMGTSDQKFILKQDGLLTNMYNQMNKTQSIEPWLDMSKKLLNAFLSGVTNFIQGDIAQSYIQNAQNSNSEDENAPPSFPDTNIIRNAINNFSDILLAGTIAKYRWPIKGSLALMSGLNSTPWHLTVGNPYSPIISLGNILVTKVDTKWSSDLGFNDMPIRIDVTIRTKLGRPLGKQEIEKIFNNSYKRVYSQAGIDRWTGTQNQATTSSTNLSGNSTLQNVLNTPSIPGSALDVINGQLVSTPDPRDPRYP